MNVLLGDTPHYLDEVRLAVKYDLPIIVVKGSPVCDEIIRNSQDEEDSVWDLVEPGKRAKQANNPQQQQQILIIIPFYFYYEKKKCKNC